MSGYIENFLDDGIDLLLNGDGQAFLERYYDYIDKGYTDMSRGKSPNILYFDSILQGDKKVEIIQKMFEKGLFSIHSLNSSSFSYSIYFSSRYSKCRQQTVRK